MVPTMSERKDLAKQFSADVARMQRCLEAAGKQVDDDDVVYAWSDYSDTVCAEWLSLCESDDALLSILSKHLPPANTRWRIPIIEAGDNSGAVIMALPPALLTQARWKAGDTLYVVMDEPSVLTVQRVE